MGPSQIGDKRPLLAVVRGNPDFAVSVASTVRDTLVSSVQQSLAIPDEQIVQQCLSVQTNFFDFRNAIANESLFNDDRVPVELRHGPLG